MVVGAGCLYIRLILSLFAVHGSYILLTVAALVQERRGSSLDPTPEEAVLRPTWELVLDSRFSYFWALHACSCWEELVSSGQK